jgi:hypothetical protein
VLEHLGPDELDPDYAAYVSSRYQQLLDGSHPTRALTARKPRFQTARIPRFPAADNTAAAGDD